jgi:hypothetical protein
MEVLMADRVEKLPVKDDKMTPVQLLAKLDAQRAEILATAKADALQKANEAVDELNALGFHYRLSEEGDKPAGTKRGEPADVPCPICTFKTAPPHDKRSHRTQEPKKPFTEEELKQRNLVRV